eukprot:gnl/MRDRNA2_/MRDRNA2_76936_c0_seq2.p1 gnl/MRDRNA2_/MRDRNA2_76936_c0~~gnl/MRDRNA2_/MRDRNA2_76936_c0_seq2.p1  ORF type:complete len:315 (-),score=80.38 gnl/MRDRNA2_/MRDRNA2_76936_c0_seq2:142-1086(-)
MSCDVRQPGPPAPDPHGALSDLSQAAWRAREAALEEQMQQLAEAWLSSQDRMCESDERWRAEVQMEEEESRMWKRRADDLHAKLACSDEEVGALQQLLIRPASQDDGVDLESEAFTRALDAERRARACAEEKCSLFIAEMRTQTMQHQDREGQWLAERRLLLEQRVSDKEAMCQLRNLADDLRARWEAQTSSSVQVEREKLLTEIQEQRSEMASLRNQNEELRGGSLEGRNDKSNQPMYLLNIDAMLSPRAETSIEAETVSQSSTFSPAKQFQVAPNFSGSGHGIKDRASDFTFEKSLEDPNSPRQLPGVDLTR